MDLSVKLIEDVCWMASSDSGHGIVLDGSPDIGGKNLGMRPMELVLAGLGGCTAMDVISILRKQRQKVEDCTIDVAAQRAESIPKVFTHITLTYRVKGRDLNVQGIKRAVELSAKTYCSVSQMLGATVQFKYLIEITDRNHEEPITILELLAD